MKPKFRDFDTPMPLKVLLESFRLVKISRDESDHKIGDNQIALVYIALQLEENKILFSDLLFLRIFLFGPTLKKRQSASCVGQTSLKYVRIC